MAIWYVDLASGNDTTGNGSSGNPYKTEYKCVTSGANGDEIRVAKTSAHTTVSGVANFTFTDGSKTVATSADARGSFSVGDYIAKTTATGNGNFETFYRITATAVDSLTIAHFYYGTTEAVANVLKAVYVTSAQGYTNTIQTWLSNKGTWLISGGWNLATETRDGETWAKHSFARSTTGSYYYTAGASTLTVRYMNIIESNRAFFIHTSTQSILDCTFITAGRPYDFTANIPIVENAVLHGDATDLHLHPNTATTIANTYKRVFLSTTTGTTGVFYCAGGVYTGKLFDENCILQGATIMVSVIANASRTDIDLGYCKIRYCSRGMSIVGNSSVVSNAETIGCGYGVLLATGNGIILENISTTSSTYGIGSVSNDDKNMTVLGGTSTNDSYSIILSTQYAGQMFISGRTFDNPTNYALYHVLDGERWTVVDCTFTNCVDAKVCYNPALAQFAQPRYVLGNCTGARNGQYYPYFVLAESTAVYRTVQPALVCNFASVFSTQCQDTQMWSTYCDNTKSYTISCWMMKADGWAGSIVPVFRLNGRELQRETAITSLTTDWVKYSWTISSATIPNDGELSLGFVLNANTIAFYFDDFECEEA